LLRLPGDQLQQAAEAAPVEGLLGEGLQEKGKSVSFGTDAGQLDGELERRFSGLLKTLRHRCLGCIGFMALPHLPLKSTL